MELNEISILDVDLDFVSSVTLTDIYGYMTYLSRDRAYCIRTADSLRLWSQCCLQSA